MHTTFKLWKNLKIVKNLGCKHCLTQIGCKVNNMEKSNKSPCRRAPKLGLERQPEIYISFFPLPHHKKKKKNHTHQKHWSFRLDVVKKKEKKQICVFPCLNSDKHVWRAVQHNKIKFQPTRLTRCPHQTVWQLTVVRCPQWLVGPLAAASSR